MIIHQAPNFSRLIFLFLSFFFFQTLNAQFSISGGFTLGYAPNVNYEKSSGKEYNLSGSTYSVFGELRIDEKFLGRAQFTNLNKSSIVSEISTNLIYGRSISGSVGYAFMGGKQKKYEIPVFLTAGAGVFASEETVTDTSFQFGLTISPRVRLIKGLWAMGEYRNLKGFFGSDYTGALSFSEFGIGLRYEL